jgi:hypothetical protein
MAAFTWDASDYGAGRRCARRYGPLAASSVSWLVPSACSRLGEACPAAFYEAVAACQLHPSIVLPR